MMGGNSSGIGAGRTSSSPAVRSQLSQAASAGGNYGPNGSSMDPQVASLVEGAMDSAVSDGSVVDVGSYQKAMNKLYGDRFGKFPDSPSGMINGSMVYQDGDSWVCQSMFNPNDYTITSTRGQANSRARGKSSSKTAINGNGYRNFVAGGKSYYAVFSVDNTWSGFRVASSLSGAKQMASSLDKNGRKIR